MGRPWGELKGPLIVGSWEGHDGGWEGYGSNGAGSWIIGSDGAGRAYDQRELGGPLIKGSWAGPLEGLKGSWKGLGGSWKGLGGS